MAYVKPTLPVTIAPVQFESTSAVLDRLNEMTPTTWSAQLGYLLNGIIRAHNAMCFTACGSTIGTGLTGVRFTNNIQYSINGFAYSATATDNFWTLTTACNCTNAYWQGVWLGLNAAGTAVVQAGTQATTQAGIVMPTPAATTCVIAYMTIHPTGTGNFTGGTTALNDGTVIPNAAFYDLTVPGCLTLFT